MIQTLLQGDCLERMQDLGGFDMAFADPPDSIGRDYGPDVDDELDPEEYYKFLDRVLWTMTTCAPRVWVSFNKKHLLKMSYFVDQLLQRKEGWVFQPCVQAFTFGTYRHWGLANCHRPLWLLHASDAEIYYDQARVESQRQRNGDKRADPRGKIPTDVFDFPRVTGNATQKRAWHDNQLHEGLVERCILLSTLAGGTVLDPFAGTGTTLRVSERLGRRCTTIELNSAFCHHIAIENGLIGGAGKWVSAIK